MLCPNFENFCPNNGQFFSVGDATASPASSCRALMGVGICYQRYKERFEQQKGRPNVKCLRCRKSLKEEV